MPHSIFIETTIPSLYVSRPSRDLLQLARQEFTREWWDTQRQQFDLFTSQLVLDEAADGDESDGDGHGSLQRGGQGFHRGASFGAGGAGGGTSTAGKPAVLLRVMGPVAVGAWMKRASIPG